MSFKVVNTLDAKEMTSGEKLKRWLKTFQCSKDNKIQSFLHQNSVVFAKKRFSITYLVMNQCDEIAGYFTLVNKPLFISQELDEESRRQVASFCQPYSFQDKCDNQLLVSAYLIAQFAKTSAVLDGECVSGENLMYYTIMTLRDIQKRIGGGVVFLECQEEKKLLDFYGRFGFQKFGSRISSSSRTKYIQLFRIL